MVSDDLVRIVLAVSLPEVVARATANDTGWLGRVPGRRPSARATCEMSQGWKGQARLQPWYANALKRSAKTPKLHVLDSGLFAAARGGTVGRVRADRGTFGTFLESLVLSESLRACAETIERPRFWCLRCGWRVHRDQTSPFHICQIAFEAVSPTPILCTSGQNRDRSIVSVQALKRTVESDLQLTLYHVHDRADARSGLRAGAPRRNDCRNRGQGICDRAVRRFRGASNLG